MARILTVYANQLRPDDIVVLDDYMIANFFADGEAPYYGKRMRVYERPIIDEDGDIRINIEGFIGFVNLHHQFTLDVTATFKKD